ncbi:thioesterase [Sphaerisporangium rufum]|uniref:Thioesterase n=2 Tax=Sphaerisporangium rufum TaxID=1381558 RepID=A0A919V029_9ACTN|nr:thioesterase [Sphaerisporangium rufum]
MRVRERGRAKAGSWLAELRPAMVEPVARVVALPHAGAGPNALMPLLSCLPDDHEVLGVTLPGRERRFTEGYPEGPQDPAPIVEAIVGELAALPTRPTVLFGHSMGVALAVAVALARPELCNALVLSAHPPAGARAERAGEWDEETLLKIIKLGGGTPDEILENAFWRGYLIGLLRSDLGLAGTLVRRNLAGRLALPLTVLGGTHDELVDPPELAGWIRRTDARVRFRLLPGGHFYLMDEPHRRIVAAEIARAVSPAAAARPYEP